MPTALLLALGAGCGSPAGATHHTVAKTTGPASTKPSPSPSASPSPTGCAAPWSCDQQQRFAAASSYITAHGTGGDNYLSVVFTDRQTGATWHAGDPTHPGWTASTIKLAMATDILRRQRAGTATLTPADQHDLATMLNFSDDNAADRLFKRFGGDDQLARFRSDFGMTGVAFQPGFSSSTYWGFVKCTTNDLAALMHYIFTTTDPADRTYLINAMRGVASNQQWGVWAAGSAQQPGNKDGWSEEHDSYGKHWVTNSVGFAGPDERYLVAIMYQVAPGGTLAQGVHTISDVIALLFGATTPAPVTVPAPDG